MTRAYRDDRELSGLPGGFPDRSAAPERVPCPANTLESEPGSGGAGHLLVAAPSCQLPVTGQDGDTWSPGVVLGSRLVAGEDLVDAGEDIGVEADVQRALRGV